MGHAIERSFQLYGTPYRTFVYFNFMGPRGEVLSKNNVRLEVNSGEKKTFFTAKRRNFLALNAVKAVNFCKICAEFSGEKFFLTAFTGFLTKKETAVQRFEPLIYRMSPTLYSTAPSVTFFSNISCEFKISVEFSGENL